MYRFTHVLELCNAFLYSGIYGTFRNGGRAYFHGSYSNYFAGFGICLSGFIKTSTCMGKTDLFISKIKGVEKC